MESIWSIKQCFAMKQQGDPMDLSSIVACASRGGSGRRLNLSKIDLSSSIEINGLTFFVT
jgi:hypothetical protein